MEYDVENETDRQPLVQRNKTPYDYTDMFVDEQQSVSHLNTPTQVWDHYVG